MDRFDRLAIAALAALLAASTAVIYDHRGEAGPVSAGPLQAAAPASPADRAELERAEKLARNLLDAGNLTQAEPLVRELVRAHPYQGGPHMLMGDLFMRQQDPVQAMAAYRRAVDIEPDYLDRKTPLFQGKKLKNAVSEALAEINSRLKQNPGDALLQREKKVIHYLYRRIAGSCG